MYIHMESKEEMKFSGLTTPGLPGITIGHTPYAGWSITLGMSDISDIFVERFEKKEGSNLYQVDGKFEEAKVIHQKINIKGSNTPYEFDVLITKHGPILQQLSGSIISLFAFV